MFIAVRTGLEPVTPCVTGMYSNQLNYAPIRTKTLIANKKYKCKSFFIFFVIIFQEAGRS